MRLIRRIRNLLQFQLEQFILRGTLSRLFVIALAMVLIAVSAGLLAYSSLPKADYADPGAAMWWAFLRLTDSGYLGDDQGPWLRAISTTLTVLGVVLFVGALIATMTQWLDDTIEALEAGYTPIAQNNHILILGWTNRTAEMIEQLVDSEARVKRLLRTRGGGRLRIVVLADRVTPALAAEIRDQLGSRYKPRQITLRSGSPLRAEHLKRVDYLHAAAIVLPAREFDANSAPDERTIKTLMSAAASAGEVDPANLPLVVAELFDSDLIVTARHAYPGAAEIVGTPQIIARMLVQTARHPGASAIYGELLGGGIAGQYNQVFVRDAPSLIGTTLVEAAAYYPDAVLLGVAENGKLEPVHADPARCITADDRLSFIAREFDDCEPLKRAPSASAPEKSLTMGEPVLGRVGQRIAVFGWNQKLPALLAELDARGHERVRVDVYSLLPIAEREALLRRRGIKLAHVTLKHVEIDLTSHAEMSEHDMRGYDTAILVAGDWLGSAEAGDARLLLAYLVLRRLLADQSARPSIVVETLAEENAVLFSGPDVECLVSPVMQSNLLTQVALKRELHWVIDDMFGAGGAELDFHLVSQLDESFRSASFADVAAACAARGEILLGVLGHRADGAREAHLNPEDKQAPLGLDAGDELIVLTS